MHVKVPTVGGRGHLGYVTTVMLSVFSAFSFAFDHLRLLENFSKYYFYQLHLKGNKMVTPVVTNQLVASREDYFVCHRLAPQITPICDHINH